MATDQDELRKKNEELSQAYKEKSRKLLNTQELYDKLKRRLMLGQIQDAASDAVDATMNGGLGQVSYRNDNVESQAPFEQQFGTPMTGHRYSDRLNQPAGMPAHLRMGPPDIRSTTWARPAYPQGSYITLKCWRTTISCFDSGDSFNTRNSPPAPRGRSSWPVCYTWLRRRHTNGFGWQRKNAAPSA